VFTFIFRENLLFYREEGGSTFFENFGKFIIDNMAPYPT
jgi:hypothetical protein